MLLATGCGQKGDTGAQGPQGVPGLAVTNTGGSLSATAVQFCPGYTPSYPNVFPEDGVCLNGKMYAILDQSNGYDYLTYLPPGVYESEATGAPCTFTLLANCQVQN